MRMQAVPVVEIVDMSPPRDGKALKAIITILGACLLVSTAFVAFSALATGHDAQVAGTALAVAAPPGPPCSSICVYNNGMTFLSYQVYQWVAAKADYFPVTGATATTEYPVYQSKCFSLRDNTAISPGAQVIPVVNAYLGLPPHHTQVIPKTESGDFLTVTYNPNFAVQVSYVCTSNILAFDMTCVQSPPPPTADDVAKDTQLFLQGLGDELSDDFGPAADCKQDAQELYKDIKTFIDTMKDGINSLIAYKVIQGFQEIVPVVKEVLLTLKACKKAEDAIRDKLTEVISILSGNIATIIKVAVSEAVTIVTNEGALTTDAQEVINSWDGGDYQGSGKALGKIIAILLGMKKPSA